MSTEAAHPAQLSLSPAHGTSGLFQRPILALTPGLWCDSVAAVARGIWPRRLSCGESRKAGGGSALVTGLELGGSGYLREEWFRPTPTPNTIALSCLPVQPEVHRSPMLLLPAHPPTLLLPPTHSVIRHQLQRDPPLPCSFPCTGVRSTHPAFETLGSLTFIGL